MKRSHCFRIFHMLYILGFVSLIATEGEGQIIYWQHNPTITFTIDEGIVVGEQCQLETLPINSSSTFKYIGGRSTSKITVHTSCTAPLFTLKVYATINNGKAVAQGEVTLNSGAATDFIREIPILEMNGRATLNYTASAKFEDGTGIDSHTVYYTIQAQ